MNFQRLDWEVLERLRSLFLSASFDGSAYWRNEEELRQYDDTFGERIGWKWDAVLRELRLRGWSPPPGVETIVDWGCGSGIAGRRVLGAFPGMRQLLVSDVSPLAMHVAAARARETFPEITVTGQAPSALAGTAPGFVLVVSHVLNELPAPARAELVQLARRAAAVLWVEPGTHQMSRELQKTRDELLAGLEVVAPCTHQEKCGLLVAGMERHWCHHFAPPPPEVFQNPDWSRFAQRAGIDLGAVPYSFVVLQQQQQQQRREIRPGEKSEPGWERLLGGARVYKPEARVLSCGAGGVTEVIVPKRSFPELHKAFKRDRNPVLARWQRRGNVATGVETGPF